MAGSKVTLAELEVRMNGLSAVEKYNTLIQGAGSATELAAKQFEALDRQQQAVASSATTTTTRLRETDREWKSLERSIPGTTAAMERFQRVSSQADAALAAGRITAEQHAAAVARLKARYVEAADGTQQLANANDNASGRMRGALGGVSQQIQDVTVQAQMGTSAFVIMAQQGPQIAGAFGPAGAAIGAVIAIASVAAGAILGMGKSADSAETSFTSYAKALEFAASASEKTRNASEGAKAAIEAESRAAAGAAQARLNKAQTELRALEAAMNFTASGDASANAGAAITYLLKSGDVRALAQEVLILRAALGEYADGARDARIQTETGASKLRDARGAIEDYRVGLREQVAALNVEIATFGASAEAKLRAKLEMEALAKAQAAGRTQIDAGTRALIDQVVALQKNIDQLEAQKKALEDAAKAAAALATAQARAAASLYTTEADLDAKIKALKGGEEAMKAYAAEQVRSAARSKAYDDAVKSGLSPLDATAEANRIAAKAVEAYRLEMERAEKVKAGNKAETQAERDAKALGRVTDQLAQQVDAQRALAVATLAGGDAMAEANTQARIAMQLSRARVEAGSAEAARIEGLVREEAAWLKVGTAANTVRQAIDAGRTPTEAYGARVDELTRSLKTLQAAGIQPSAADMAALNRGLQEMNPAFAEIRETAASAEEFPDDVGEDAACLAIFLEALA